MTHLDESRPTIWHPLELTFLTNERYGTPYTDVEVTVTFEHESGRTIEVPGFWNGGPQWQCRFSPSLAGSWTWESESTPVDEDLQASGGFEVAGYDGPNLLARHGFLTVEEGERHIEHADGTPFFWLGDTVWAAGAKATPEEWNHYVTRRRAQGFNVVQINSLQQWDASRPIDRWPFGDEWDLDAPRPSYFQALDGLVERCYENGMVAALVALWYNYVDGERDPEPASHFSTEDAARYGRYLAARYGAYGTAWLVSGDAGVPEEAVEVYDAAGTAIREHVTHPLLTTHLHSGQVTPDSLNERSWLDFHMYQSGHHWGEREHQAHEYATEARSLDPARPVINGEPCYEHIHYFESPKRRVSREKVRRAAWWSVLAGGNAGITYGGQGLWSWHRRGDSFGMEGKPRPWREAVRMAGADDFAFCKQFFERYAYGKLEPRQDLLVDHDAAVRAAFLPEDDVLLVYTPEAMKVRLDSSELPDVATFEWVDPASGRVVETETHANGDTLVVTEPPWTGDAVLRIRS